MLRKRHKLRKGQVAAGGAASLIALIALIIIVYVILLPPDVRKDLLDNDSNGSGDGISANDLARVLVQDDTGTLDKLAQDQFEHHLSAVTLYTTKSASALFEADSVYVKYGMFDKQFKNIKFSVDNPDAVDNALLSLHATKKSGVITIKLNGRTLIDSEIPEYPNPVKIDSDLIKKDNTLSIEVSDVGFAFWHTNEYVLENLMITGDITDSSQQESTSTFSVTREEKDNLEKAELRFFPDCRASDVGKLEVLMNNQMVYNSVPDCGSVNIVDLSPGYLNEGTNKLAFKADKGYYLIDQIKVNTDLSKITYPIYYFELDPEDMEEIENENLKVNMTFKFVDDSELKSATLYINGRRASINTRDSEYSRDITNFVDEGNNAIKIEPESDRIDIIDFKILLQEID